MNAELEAVSFGGHLITINDAEEDAFAFSIATPGAYIGYNDIAVEGTFEWVSGEIVVPLYENWSFGEPTGDSDFVHLLGNGLWNDVTQAHPGIMELALTCADAFGPPPFDPTPTKIPNPGPGNGDLFGIALSVSGNNVLVGSPGSFIGPIATGQAYLFDLTNNNLLRMVEVGFVDLPISLAADIFVSGDLAFVASWDAGVRIVDVSNPAEPTEVGAIEAPDLLAFDIFASDGLIFVAGSLSEADDASAKVGGSLLMGEKGGLLVVDVSDPAAPVEVGSIDGVSLATFPPRVFVSNGLVFFAAGKSGLLIIKPDVATQASD